MSLLQNGAILCLRHCLPIVHSSTGFYPFYLLFGRAPRGPMQILSDVFLNKNLSRDTSFQYQYVIDLHNRIRKGWRIAQESVRDSASVSRLRHEPKSRLKHFMPGDEVLVLLPTSDNKLVLSYKGPYTVVEKRTGVIYLVDLGDRKCTFHVNLLRKYKRSTCPPPPSDDLVGVDGACSGRVTCLVNDSVSEAEKVSGELKGHGWDCYHCVSHELFERDPGCVGAKDLTLGLSIPMNYIPYSTTSSTEEDLRWIKLRSVCLCE
ncbi:Zinc finger protein [Plakobranchus ocellatus]|uniref:Zinc finger protein n=1 Tax=Plakobranchus ocellatus TaxID=259542 RepID=A0AAV4B6C7_9GAST|nr:Zinc finger protein [Plakobranchus ocellatus]